jgi:hypothetical protein
MEARYFRLIKSRHACTPHHDDSTTTNITQPNMWDFTGEQMSDGKPSCWQVRQSVGTQQVTWVVETWDTEYLVYDAFGFRALLCRVFCRGSGAPQSVRFPARAAFLNQDPAGNCGQEFNICAQRNKLTYRTESEP